jgi:LysM repeat protein
MAGWVAGDEPESAAAAPAAPATSEAIAENGIVAPPVVISEPGEDGAIYHEVLLGQSAWTIAARYGLTVDQLYELNDLTADSIIHPGDQLLIRPANTPKPTETPLPTATATMVPLSSTPGPSLTGSSKLAFADLSTPTSSTISNPTLPDGQDTTPRRTPPPIILLLAAGALLLLLVLVIALARPGRA